MIFEHEAKALQHSRILEFHKFYSEFQLWLEAGPERFRMKIRVYETSDGRFYFVQSHYVQTPAFGGPFNSTHLTHATPEMALSTAIGSITTYYEDAVKEGHEPSPEWFVPNEAF